MSHHKHNPDNSAHRHSTAPAPEPDQHPTDEDPAVTPDQVARRAYFTYLNSGALPGHDVQHWLKAESELLEEHALKRSHAYDRPDNRSDRHPLPAQS
jgi:Protein of unknown function (DUF2934)